jgi:CPA1 family monovalent cation:H+ antiporter
LLFCAYVVVLVTLVGQGLTFGPLLARLRLPFDAGHERRTRREARLAAARAGAQQVDLVCASERVPDALAARVQQAARAQVARLETGVNALASFDDDILDAAAAEVARLWHLHIEAQREELERWRDAGRLSDRGLRELDKELDLEEIRTSV